MTGLLPPMGVAALPTSPFRWDGGSVDQSGKLVELPDWESFDVDESRILLVYTQLAAY